MTALVLWVLLTASAAPSTKPSIKPGISIVISTETPKVAVGSAPELNIEIRNNTGRVLNASGSWSNATGVDSNWVFDVRDSAGKALQRRTYNPLAIGFGKAVFRDVGPGSSLADRIDLGRLFVFRQPGKYRIQVSREIPTENGAGIAKSNVITITITK